VATPTRHLSACCGGEAIDRGRRVALGDWGLSSDRALIGARCLTPARPKADRRRRRKQLQPSICRYARTALAERPGGWSGSVQCSMSASVWPPIRRLTSEPLSQKPAEELHRNCTGPASQVLGFRPNCGRARPMGTIEFRPNGIAGQPSCKTNSRLLQPSGGQTAVQRGSRNRKRGTLATRRTVFSLGQDLRRNCSETAVALLTECWPAALERLSACSGGAIQMQSNRFGLMLVRRKGS
jgi:hypothetical protein